MSDLSLFTHDWAVGCFVTVAGSAEQHTILAVEDGGRQVRVRASSSTSVGGQLVPPSNLQPIHPTPMDTNVFVRFLADVNSQDQTYRAGERLIVLSTFGTSVLIADSIDTREPDMISAAQLSAMCKCAPPAAVPQRRARVQDIGASRMHAPSSMPNPMHDSAVATSNGLGASADNAVAHPVAARALARGRQEDDAALMRSMVDEEGEMEDMSPSHPADAAAASSSSAAEASTLRQHAALQQRVAMLEFELADANQRLSDQSTENASQLQTVRHEADAALDMLAASQQVINELHHRVCALERQLSTDRDHDRRF